MELNKEQVQALEKILGTDKACIIVDIHKEDEDDDDPKLAFNIFAGDGSTLTAQERNAIEIAIHGMVGLAVNEGEKLSKYAGQLAGIKVDLEDMEPQGSA